MYMYKYVCISLGVSRRLTIFMRNGNASYVRECKIGASNVDCAPYAFCRLVNGIIRFMNIYYKVHTFECQDTIHAISFPFHMYIALMLSSMFGSAQRCGDTIVWFKHTSKSNASAHVLLHIVGTSHDINLLCARTFRSAFSFWCVCTHECHSAVT